MYLVSLLWIFQVYLLIYLQIYKNKLSVKGSVLHTKNNIKFICYICQSLRCFASQELFDKSDTDFSAKHDYITRWMTFKDGILDSFS